MPPVREAPPEPDPEAPVLAHSTPSDGDEPEDGERTPLVGPWRVPPGAFDRQTLRILFQDQREPLFRYLYRLTGNASDAEDLLQDTFLRLWRKRDQFEGRGAVEGYLRRTAHRVFLNSRQKIDRRASLFQLVENEPEPAPAPDGEIERAETLEFLTARVREALDALPAPMREAFVLFRYEGLTCAEIADTIDVPLKTVESRVRRATLALSDRLRSYRSHL